MKKTSYILSFDKVPTYYRSLVCTKVQAALFALGCWWAGIAQTKDQTTRNENAALHLLAGNHLCQRGEIMYLDSSISQSNYCEELEVMPVFDASKPGDIEMFLGEVKQFLSKRGTYLPVRHSLAIEFTPTSANVDLSDMLQAIKGNILAEHQHLYPEAQPLNFERVTITM